ncbi:hypothetical protein OAL81_05070 [Candidatus Pelagibacter sp.]|nr:hypothetical protein [Candidatus Pelagibacter sp.]
MKKLLGIVILGLLLSSNAYADIQSTLIDRHLSNKKLDLIEGVWFIGEANNVIWKDGNSYKRKSLSKRALKCNAESRISKSGNSYSETSKATSKSCKVISICSAQYFVDEYAGSASINCQNGESANFQMMRVWPDDIRAHNAKFGGSSGGESELSFTIADKKEQCAAIGFKPATDKFADCVLKLVELDLKSQVNSPKIATKNMETQLLANELKRNNNMQQSQFLMNLSNQLLNPSSPASSMSSSSCTVRGGTIKTINCW